MSGTISDMDSAIQFCRRCRDTCARGTVAARRELLRKDNGASKRVAQELVREVESQRNRNSKNEARKEDSARKEQGELFVLVSIQALANMSALDEHAKSVAWRALLEPRSKRATTLEHLLVLLSRGGSERSKKALGRLSMLVYCCISTTDVSSPETSIASCRTAARNVRLLSFLRHRGSVFAWLRALCRDESRSKLSVDDDENDYDASEWGLLTMQKIVETRGAFDTTIRSIFGDFISKARFEDDASESALAMFLAFALVSWTNDERANKKREEEETEDTDGDEEEEEECTDDEEEEEESTDDEETKDADKTPRVMHEQDARALAVIARSLLLLVETESHSSVAVRSARGAALELCAELSCNRGTSAAEEDVVSIAAASAVRQELLPAVADLVRRVVAPMSPGHRRVAKLESGASAETRPADNVDLADENELAIRSQTVKSAMRLIANCSFRNRSWQDAVREAGGIEAVLNCTHLDERDPILREWALLAVRNLCESNRANQSRIEAIRPKKAMQDPTLKSMGYEIRLDEATGKPRLKRTDEEPKKGRK